MKLSEVCEKVIADKTAVLVRDRKEGGLEVKPYAGNKRGWVLLDLTTASVCCQVFDRVKPKVKTTLDSFPAKKAVRIIWSAVNK